MTLTRDFKKIFRNRRTNQVQRYYVCRITCVLRLSYKKKLVLLVDCPPASQKQDDIKVSWH
jgi:hypothetical protein